MFDSIKIPTTDGWQYVGGLPDEVTLFNARGLPVEATVGPLTDEQPGFTVGFSDGVTLTVPSGFRLKVVSKTGRAGDAWEPELKPVDELVGKLWIDGHYNYAVEWGVWPQHENWEYDSSVLRDVVGAVRPSEAVPVRFVESVQETFARPVRAILGGPGEFLAGPNVIPVPFQVAEPV